MRKILLLLSAAFLFFFSCATTAPEMQKPEVEEKAAAPVEEKKVETVIIDVYLVAMEIRSASDGVVDGYIEYHYDDEGLLIEKKELDGDKNILTRMSNEVSEGRIVRTQWFTGEESEPGIYIIRSYDGDNLTSEISYDIKDVPQSISSYEYNSSNQLTKWIVSSGGNVPMMVTEYEYSDGLKSRASFLTPLGELEGYIRYTWTDSKIESEKTFDEKDNLEKSIAYEYEGNNLVKEVHNRKAVIDHTIEYVYDENGNAVISTYLYRSGNVKSQTKYEYISVKREVQQ